MSLESLIVGALTTLVSGRIYPDVAPQDAVALPRIVYQQVGGEAVNYLENALPNKANARIQIACWGSTRVMAKALALQVKTAMKATIALHTTVLSEPVSIYEEDTGLYGSLIDFSCWT